jgi:hypothetical protein
MATRTANLLFFFRRELSANMRCNADVAVLFLPASSITHLHAVGGVR